MRRLSAVPVLVFSPSFAYPERLHSDRLWNQPVCGSRQSTHKQQGFFDYVLGKVNPNGNDYGSRCRQGGTPWSSTLSMICTSGRTW